VAIAVAGVGLFGTGVRGLAALDGQLSDAADRPAVREVKREHGVRDDCPASKRERHYHRSRL
jgi:hypothetical protein